MAETDAGSTPVLVEDRGPVRLLTLNRPHLRNAIDIPLRVALAEVLEAADAEASVRAIVLTGAGAAFCSGGDITTMAPMPRNEIVTRTVSAQRVVRAIWATSKPVLAAVEGAAFGAGAALAWACDRVVAGSDAVFATTFTRVGLAGDMGVFASLPTRVGPARARQMLLMGHRVTAVEGEPWGLVDAVVEPGAALQRALADAAQLAEAPPSALGVIKAMLTGEPRHPHAVLEQEIRNQADLWATADFAEGVAAFRDKRPPVFRGEGGGSPSRFQGDGA